MAHELCYYVQIYQSEFVNHAEPSKSGKNYFPSRCNVHEKLYRAI